CHNPKRPADGAHADGARLGGRIPCTRGSNSGSPSVSSMCTPKASNLKGSSTLAGGSSRRTADPPFWFQRRIEQITLETRQRGRDQASESVEGQSIRAHASAEPSSINRLCSTSR